MNKSASGKKGRKRSGPGRPEGISNARSHILDAAEEAFAELGYAGTSLREIVKRANVTSALINYYWGSKEKLFEDIFLRRSLPIVDERMTRLEELQRDKGANITVLDLVQAYVAPFRMPRTASARRFLSIHARLHYEPEDFAWELRRKVYDESTKAYAAAFRSVLPHLPLKTVYWRLIMLVGANLYAVSNTHRLAEISGGVCQPDDLDELFSHVIEFDCGGLTAPKLDAADSKNEARIAAVETLPLAGATVARRAK